MKQTKSCERCGASFERHPNYSNAQWNRARFCGRRCFGKDSAVKNPLLNFMAFVAVDPITRCWNWIGGHDDGGYGLCPEGRAHRYMFSQYVGEIPEGKWVLHRCDNRSCVNPAHLFLGDRSDNVADMFLKGREDQRSGSFNNHARLTEEEAVAIRDDPRLQEEIARTYGISQTTVSAIKLKKRWTHV